MARTKEENRIYMKAYYQANKRRWKARTQEQRERYNAKRRNDYAMDDAMREKMKESVREWSRQNPDKKKNQRLVAQFGIELSDFKDMLVLQNGRCAICGYSDMSNPNFFPVVDHCHDTGRVRGLLCMNCNQALGKFKDDVNALWSAVAYLERNG